MNHTVSAFDVGLDDMRRFIELDATLRADLEVCTVDGFRRLAVHLHDVGRLNLASDHVVREDGLEFGNVLQQAIHRAGWQLCERLVGRGEDSEGTIALERLNEISGREPS